MGRLILLIIGAALTAVLQMAWGFAFWMATDLPYDYMIQRLPLHQEEQVLKALQDANVDSGHYFYPFATKDAMTGKDEAGHKAFLQKHEEGPLVQITYHKGGLNATDEKMTYLYGYLHFLGCSLLAGLMVLLAGRGLPSYFHRLLFLVLLAVFAPAAITLANPIWYHQPWRFSLASAGFEAVAWLIAAIVLAAFVRPPRARTAYVAPSRPPVLTPDQFSRR
jgi:hypothetical protein